MLTTVVLCWGKWIEVIEFLRLYWLGMPATVFNMHEVELMKFCYLEMWICKAILVYLPPHFQISIFHIWLASRSTIPTKVKLDFTVWQRKISILNRQLVVLIVLKGHYVSLPNVLYVGVGYWPRCCLCSYYVSASYYTIIFLEMY